MRFKCRLFLFLTVVIFSGICGANELPPCYEEFSLDGNKDVLGHGNQLLIVVDRTVDFIGSDKEASNFKNKIIDFVDQARQPGDQVTLVFFGGLSGGDYPSPNFNERLAPDVPESIKKNVGRQDLKQLDTCISQQHKQFNAKFVKAVDEAFENIGNFSQTPLFEGLRYASKLLNPQAKKKSVLIFSDLMLHNNDITFYRSGRLRSLEKSTILKHQFVKDQIDQIDWLGSDLYLLGIGNGVTGSGDTEKLWLLMDTWETLLTASNAGVITMGVGDLPRQPGKPRYNDRYIDTKYQSQCRQALARFPDYSKPQRQVVVILDQTLEAAKASEKQHYLQQVGAYLNKIKQPGDEYSLITFSQLDENGYPEIKAKSINPRQIPVDLMRSLGREDKKWLQWCLNQIGSEGSKSFWNALQSQWPSVISETPHTTIFAMLDFLQQHVVGEQPAQVLFISDLMLNIDGLSLYRSGKSDGIAAISGEKSNQMVTMATERLDLKGIEILGLGVGVGATAHGDTRRLSSLRKAWHSFFEKLNAKVISLESRSIPL